MANIDQRVTQASGYSSVYARIAQAALAAGREPAAVKLVAVTKTFGKAAILPVLEAGHRVFGENRVQEALRKWPPLKERYPDIELHLLGPLQSNKVRDAIRLFDWVHTVDRPKIATALAEEMDRQARRPKLLIQVNTGAEPQKAGVMPQDAAAFAAACGGNGLDVEGLMCIPPAADDPAQHFAMLANMVKELGQRELSMGMSGDFEMAIAHGATMVRVGSAIFGSR